RSWKLAVSFSEDGKQLAYVAQEGKTYSACAMDVAGGMPRRLAVPDWNPCGVAWSLDGQEVALVAFKTGGGFESWIVPVQGGAGRRLPVTPTACGVRWAPEARVTIPSSGNRNLSLVDPR